MPVEQLLVLTLFVLAVLAQVLYRRLKQGSRGETVGTVPAGGPDRIAASPAEPVRVPAERRAVRAAARQRPRATPLGRTDARPAVRAWVGSRQDLRRGIVLMTVLGPCRGLEAAPVPARSALGDMPPAERP